MVWLLGRLSAEPGTKLHYWFAQGESDGALCELLVVLWLIGGPGSSSLIGMLSEVGPLLINGSGGLMRNPYAWTKRANLLVLESLGGVGYSYLRGGDCNNTNDSTASAARAAVQDFFATKFPELRRIHSSSLGSLTRVSTSRRLPRRNWTTRQRSTCVGSRSATHAQTWMSRRRRWTCLGTPTRTD